MIAHVGGIRGAADGVWSAIACVVCLSAFACGAPIETNSPPAAEDVRADVEAFLQAYMGAIASRDTAALRTQLAAPPRYSWAENGAVRYRSVDDVIEGLQSFPADTPIETDLSQLDVVRIGVDGAYASAAFETRVGEGAGAFAFGGLMTIALEREGQTWRIVGGHVSSPGATEREGDGQATGGGPS